jgi:hypothetical protein
MAMERPKLAIPGPELHSVRRETISMLGKTYGCGQCSGKYNCLIYSSIFFSQMCVSKSSMPPVSLLNSMSMLAQW